MSVAAPPREAQLAAFSASSASSASSALMRQSQTHGRIAVSRNPPPAVDLCLLQRHQLGPAAQGGVGDGQQRLVAQIAQGAAGGGEHAGHQDVIQRCRLDLGEASLAVHPFNASLTAWAAHGFATAAARWKVATLETYRRTVAGALLEAMASMKAQPLRRCREGLAAFLGAPTGEDHHVGTQRALGVAGEGTARGLGMLAQVGGDFGLRNDGRHGLGLTGRNGGHRAAPGGGFAFSFLRPIITLTVSGRHDGTEF